MTEINNKDSSAKVAGRGSRLAQGSNMQKNRFTAGAVLKQSTLASTTQQDNKEYFNQLQAVANKAPRIELTILSSASLAKESVI